MITRVKESLQKMKMVVLKFHNSSRKESLKKIFNEKRTNEEIEKSETNSNQSGIKNIYS